MLERKYIRILWGTPRVVGSIFVKMCDATTIVKLLNCLIQVSVARLELL